MKESKKPQLRFKGYSEDWEEKTLGEVVDVCSGRDYKHLKPGKIPVYGTGGYMLSVNDALSYKTNAIGIGRKGTIDKPYILKAPFWTVDTLFYCLTKENNNLYFVYDVFQLVDWKQKDESTGVPSLSKISINETAVFITNSIEQTKIGTLFKNIDTLITSKKAKYEKLLQIKKSLLEKMFPQDGQATPTLRFKGFTEDWEEKTLGEVCSISTGKSNTQDKIENGKYPFYVRSPIIERSNRYLFDEEAVLTVGDGVGTGKVFHYVNGKYDLHQRVYRMYNFTEVNAKYFYYYFSLFFYARVMSMTAKTSVDSVRMEMISDMKIKFSAISEQTRIGNFFKELDALLSLQKKELDKLQNVKKALLEKMFV